MANNKYINTVSIASFTNIGFDPIQSKHALSGWNEHYGDSTANVWHIAFQLLEWSKSLYFWKILDALGHTF